MKASLADGMSFGISLLLCELCLIISGTSGEMVQTDARYGRLSLCDPKLFSMPMVNIELGEFTIYEQSNEWKVFNLTHQPWQLMHQKPALMPAHLLRLIEKDKSILVTTNWVTDTWLAVHGKTVLHYDQQHKLENWTLTNATEPIKAVFYHPVSDRYHAIAGKETFSINLLHHHFPNATLANSKVKSFRLDVSNLKLVLFLNKRDFYLIEKLHYSQCIVKRGPEKNVIDHECQEWVNGDILCEGISSASTFLTIIIGGLLMNITILVLLLSCCYDENPAEPNRRPSSMETKERQQQQKEQAKV